MGTFAPIAKALGDEGRVRLMGALDREKELCACQLTELLALAPSTVSKHLAILKQAGLLRSRKEGRWIFYALNKESKDARVKQWLEFTLRAVRTEREYKEDKERLKAIKKLDPEELCWKQRCC
jgi:ArsR family transcriptional regulator, arsenate/arsenite/antimonite-responsive transcriptional repressor